LVGSENATVELTWIASGPTGALGREVLPPPPIVSHPLVLLATALKVVLLVLLTVTEAERFPDGNENETVLGLTLMLPEPLPTVNVTGMLIGAPGEGVTVIDPG
jgi:hypothetical protein